MRVPVDVAQNDADDDARGHAAPSSRRRAVVGPLVCGCALVGAAVYLAAVDPASTVVPACPLHELTGLWCPACGMTRATHALLRGDIAAAFGFNLLFPLFLGAIAVGWITWMRTSLGAAPVGWLTRHPALTGGAAITVLIVFAVLRNLSPFSALAP